MITPLTKTSSSEPAGSKTRPGAKEPGMPPGREDAARRQRLLIAGIAGGAVVLGLVLLLILRPWQKPPPKLGGEPSKLGEFVSTTDFQKMSFEKREIYMKMTSAKKDEIAKAYAEGRLSIEDYQKSLLAAHLGKRLDDMRKYFAKPMGAERLKYLDKQLVKKDTKKETRDHDPAAKKVEEEQDLLKDDVAETAEIETWPPDVRAKYKEYMEALIERKKLHKAAIEAKAPRKATTSTAPATRPN
jgi:hypothetical protein